MKYQIKPSLLPFFFALSACSWMPHWACHYYRLETGTSFVVGSWNYSPMDSYLSLVVYSILIGLNVLAVGIPRVRITSAMASGLLHLAIGSLHIYRLWSPFTFEVFGYEWSLDASLREVLIVVPFGILCLVVALKKELTTEDTGGKEELHRV
jgi:hypothetical protein